jgi:hypothetical protein
LEQVEQDLLLPIQKPTEIHRRHWVQQLVLDKVVTPVRLVALAGLLEHHNQTADLVLALTHRVAVVVQVLLQPVLLVVQDYQILFRDPLYYMVAVVAVVVMDKLVPVAQVAVAMELVTAELLHQELLTPVEVEVVCVVMMLLQLVTADLE